MENAQVDDFIPPLLDKTIMSARGKHKHDGEDLCPVLPRRAIAPMHMSLFRNTQQKRKKREREEDLLSDTKQGKDACRWVMTAVMVMLMMTIIITIE